MISSRPLAAGSPSKAACTSSASVQPQLGDRLQKTNRDRFGLCQRVRRILACLAVVTKRAGDLLGQSFVQRFDQVADVVGDVGPVQVLPPAVPGIEDLPQIGQDVHDLSIAGQRAVAEVMDRAALVVGFDDPPRDLRQRRFLRDIRTHRPGPFASLRFACREGIAALNRGTAY